jgi:hypothetical protein
MLDSHPYQPKVLEIGWCQSSRGNLFWATKENRIPLPTSLSMGGASSHRDEELLSLALPLDTRSFSS